MVRACPRTGERTRAQSGVWLAMRTCIRCAEQAWSVVFEREPAWVIVKSLAGERRATAARVHAGLVYEHIYDAVEYSTFQLVVTATLPCCHQTKILRGVWRLQ